MSPYRICRSYANPESAWAPRATAASDRRTGGQQAFSWHLVAGAILCGTALVAQAQDFKWITPDEGGGNYVRFSGNPCRAGKNMTRYYTPVGQPGTLSQSRPSPRATEIGYYRPSFVSRPDRFLMRVLVTGAAGFIGSALTLRLLGRGDEVIGVDNLNDYYDPELKRARLARCAGHADYCDINASIADRSAMETLFRVRRPQRVVHLAAQAGVRYSLTHPYAYIDSNLVGFGNILEGCRQQPVEHLVYASTSSVYGANTRLPFSEHDGANHPLTLYAASKRANELMAHSYSHLYQLPTTGLRFFTVYGPWGRPDMALFKFTRAILQDEPIQVYNYGQHRRSFTYIDDIIEGVVRVLDTVPAGSAQWSGDAPDPAISAAPYRIYNIGSDTAVELLQYLEVLERCLGKKARIELLPLQAGDVPDTCADVSDLRHEVGYAPATPIEVGVERFVTWYCEYYKT